MIWFDTVERDYYTRANTYTFYRFSPGSIIRANSPGVLKIIEGYGEVTLNGVQQLYSPGFVSRF